LTAVIAETFRGGYGLGLTYAKTMSAPNCIDEDMS
jgi:hypothetical protein